MRPTGRIAFQQSTLSAQTPEQLPDRNLALELVRVTEAAALATAPLVGRGDKEAADQAAVDGMRYMLQSVQMDGVVVIGEGDGWVRSYEALSGKKLWEFDTNPKNSVWPKTRNEIVATPVIWQNKVYIANGQDPEAGAGPAHLYAIDATKRGDITTSGRVWDYDKVSRTISNVAIDNGLLFIADLAGFLHCLDVHTGKPYWTHDVLAKVWASPMVIAGRVYLGDEDGDVVVMEAAKEKKLIFETNMGSNVYSTVVPANGTLFVTNRNQLFALAAKP